MSLQAAHSYYLPSTTPVEPSGGVVYHLQPLADPLMVLPITCNNVLPSIEPKNEILPCYHYLPMVGISLSQNMYIILECRLESI